MNTEAIKVLKIVNNASGKCVYSEYTFQSTISGSTAASMKIAVFWVVAP
jgi:hypothetical protein